ncbi:Zn-dependent exopeptidase [Clavulina sp. PMI_390]|nr:Zn-dependent exopeptidase [Clavulina sp. PMI_390]
MTLLPGEQAILNLTSHEKSSGDCQAGTFDRCSTTTSPKQHQAPPINPDTTPSSTCSNDDHEDHPGKRKAKHHLTYRDGGDLAGLEDGLGMKRGASANMHVASPRRVGVALAPWSTRLLGMALLAVVILCFKVLPSTSWTAVSFLQSWSIERATVWSSGIRLGTQVPMCPQAKPLIPRTGTGAQILEHLENTYHTAAFQNRSAAWLSGAVQIPTESYDDFGPVGADPRWDIFADLHAYLQRAFPLTFTTLEFTPVNIYNIVLHWQGEDDSLKPLLLTAHQDVVPVDPTTVNQWVHPPYSGHFDGTYIFGRGTRDDKSGLIGILSSFETLLEAGFKPRRTIVLAAGIDEEATAEFGAGKLASYLEETYGFDGFAMLVDEGGECSGILQFLVTKRSIQILGFLADEHGIFVALPDIGEKGYLDVRVEISTPGGHSSVPPPHTSIGLLALSIALIERNPHTPHLSRTSPFYNTVQCIAENGNDIPSDYLKLVRKSLTSDTALKELERQLVTTSGAIANALLTTTQAVDIVHGGVKVNALPETANAVVNHRISVDSSVNELMAHLTTLLLPLASEYNLNFISFGQDLSSQTRPVITPCIEQHAPKLLNIPTPSSDSACLSALNASGTLRLSDAYNTALEPAPITPTDTAAYKILSGSIHATHARTTFSDPKVKQKEMIVSPNVSGGNTDTRYYWNLTRNIFRYNHLPVYEPPFGGGVHTVNEAVPVESLVEDIRFFTLLILNADASDEL